MQILRPPGHVVGGSILFRGEDILGLSTEELRRFRWRNVSIVFQSAMNSLNPLMRVGDQFVDMIRAHERIDKRRALVRAGELLELVGHRPAPPARLPARALRRDAPARDHRDGARAQARADRSWTSRRPRSTSSCSARSSSRSTRSSASSASPCSSSRTTSRCCSSSRDRIAIMYAGEIVESTTAERLATAAAAPVHAGAARLVPAADRAARAPDRDPRRAARPARSAGRLPLPSALPALPPGAARAVHPADDRAAGPARDRSPGITWPATSSRKATRERGRARGPRPDEALPRRRRDPPLALARRRRRLLRAPRRHDHRARRRERQRQEHRRPPARAARRADRGHGALPGRRRLTHARARRRVLRYRSQVQIIFQDPFDSLNPVKTVRHHIERPLRIHNVVPSDQVEERVHELLRARRPRTRRRRSPRSTRTSSRAASASASRSRACSPSSRRSSSRTSRRACSTSRSASGS